MESDVSQRCTRGWTARMRFASIAAVTAIGAGGVAVAAGDPWADRIEQRLQEARAEAGIGRLERREALDRVARERAEAIAALPHARRLSQKASLETGLKEAGVGRYRHAATHLDMNRGYTDPAGAFLRDWRDYSIAWSSAMDPRYDAMGLATTRAADGWIILFAVFLEDLPEPGDLREVELRTLEAVNRVREESGLGALAERDTLVGIARAYSEDMIRRGFFAHVTPEGSELEDRMRAAGLSYRKVAENIQRNRGWDDPVKIAVDSWMDSRGHREAILTPDFTETGVGVAVADDGTVYFTQVFLLPRAAGPSSADEPPAP